MYLHVIHVHVDLPVMRKCPDNSVDSYLAEDLSTCPTSSQWTRNRDDIAVQNFNAVGVTDVGPLALPRASEFDSLLSERTITPMILNQHCHLLSF